MQVGNHMDDFINLWTTEDDYEICPFCLTFGRDGHIIDCCNGTQCDICGHIFMIGNCNERKGIDYAKSKQRTSRFREY